MHFGITQTHISFLDGSAENMYNWDLLHEIKKVLVFFS